MSAFGLSRAVGRRLPAPSAVVWKVFVCFFLLGCLRAFGAGLPVQYDGVIAYLGSGSVTGPLGVAVDLSGNLYIADTGGNRVVKVSADGTTAPLSITGISPGLLFPKGLAVDSAGNLYIADAGNSRIVKVDSSGNGSVVSTPSITLSNPQGVAVNTSGDIFISDTGNNRIIKVAAAGTATTLATSSGTALTGLSSPKGIAVDSFGNLYIVDSGNDRVIKVTTALAGSALSTNSALNSPIAVSVGMNGLVYIVDGASNQRVTIVAPQGDTYDMLFGAQNLALASAAAIAVSPLGVVYVADSSGNKVNAFHVDAAGFGHVALGSSGTPQTLSFTVSGTTTLSGIAAYTAGTQNLDFTIAANSGTPCTTGSSGITCTVNVQFTPTKAGLRRGALVLSYNSGAGSLQVPLYGYGDAPVATFSPGVASVVPVTSVAINQPFQTARDGAENIYVTSYQNSTVTKIPAGGGTGSTVTIPALPTISTISSPTGLAIDGAGNLFISDYQNSRLVEVTPAGTAKVVAVRGLSPGLTYSTTLSFLPNGRLVVDDYGSGRIILLSPDIYDNDSNDGDGTIGIATGYVLPLGGYSLGASNAAGATTDALGNFYVADRTNQRLVKIDPLGKATVLSFSNISLNEPYGVAVDPSQNLYVLDSGNQRVVQKTASGTASILDSVNFSFGSSAFGIDIDSSGNVLISDFNNNRLVFDNVGKSSLSFPDTRQYSYSAPKVSTVTNLGNQNLTFSADPVYTIDFTRDGTDTNPCSSSTSLVPGASCDVSIIFSPQSASSLNANIVVTNDNLNASGSTQMITVSGTGTADVTTLTSVGSAGTSFSYGQPLTIAVKVQDQTDTSASPTGTVTFTDSLTSVIAQKTVDNTGTATLLNNSFLSGIGVHSISAAYASGTGEYQSSQTTLNITITKNTVALTGPNQVQLIGGQAGSAAITVAPDPANAPIAPGAALPSGTVSYSILSGSNVVVGPATAALTVGNSSSAAAVPIANTLTPGIYTISVSYPGDGNYQSASAISIPLAIARITPAITWAPTGSVTYGTNLSGILTASAANNGTTVPGTFSYTATPTGGSSAAVGATTILGAGTYVLTATFSPTDTTTFTTQTSTASFTVTQTTSSTALVSSPNPATTTGAVAFTATVSSTSGSPTGTVSFYDGSTLLSTASLSQGQATYSVSSLSVGTHSIKAEYSGDTNFSASTSTAVSQTISKASTTTALVSSTNPSLVTSAVTFTATITPSVTGTATGTAAFYDSTTLLGTVALSQGTAVYTTSSLAVGTHSITVVYSGDGSFSSSTSTAVAQLIQDFSISSATTPGSSSGTPSVSVAPGGTATYTLNLGPSAGTVLVAPVTLSLSGLPPGATGTLSPQVLPAGSSLSSVILTIQLPKVTAAIQAERTQKVGLAMTFLPLFLLPFAGRMKQAAKSLRGLGCIAILLLLSLGAVVGLTGCGSTTSGYFGQAEKSYTIYITATSGAVSHSTSVSLTVQ